MSSPLVLPRSDTPASRPVEWARQVVRNSLCHAQAYWYLYVPVVVIWVFAFSRVFIDPTPRLPILFNWTSSLPYTVAVMQYRSGQPLQRGDFIVYAFDGDAQRTYPGLRGQPLFKQIRGVPGDQVTVIGRQVFVNGISAGAAKPHTFDGRPLQPIAETVIPPGFYYVQGTHPNSFDSRYRASGLVAARHVIGKVSPLF
jgi:conjugal transfer pilin signal peptidase TrbI